MTRQLHGLQAMFDGEPSLVPGALRGYRSWSGLSLAGQLVSTGMRHSWVAGPFGGRSEVARCLRSLGMPQHAEAAPGRDCPCGLYGWYAPDDVRIVPEPIVGVVQATGRVVLGSHGFRAERLEVLGVTTQPGFPHLLEALWWLGFRTFPDQGAMVEALPPDDVSDLVGHECDGRCTSQGPGMLSLLGSSAQAAQQLQAAFQQLVAVTAAQTNHVHVALQALAAAADGGEDEPGPPTRSLRRRVLDAVRGRGTGPSGTAFAKQGRP